MPTAGLGKAVAKAQVPRTLSLSRNEAQGQKDRRRSALNPALQHLLEML